ncbi:MAG: hypothetical protein FJX45_13580 [Alphaproteobacteria bacterium]|nr:hypothetical protein [Alphaproteobacteria bacterium]
MRNSLLTLAVIAALASGAGSAEAQAPQPPDPKERPAPVAETSEGRQALAASQAKLAIELIERLSKPDNADTTISPASLASALAIVSEGADPNMKKAIAKVMGFGAADAPKSMALLAEARQALAAGAGDVFQSADRIVLAPGGGPAPDLLQRLDHAKILHTEEDLSKPEVAAGIDAWVKEATKGMIPEILGGPLENVSFVALNALHFKGKWKTPFDPKLTAPAPFKSADGKAEDVAMMRLSEGRRLFRTDKQFIGVDLPFAGERFSLVIVTSLEKPLPAKDFAKAGDWLSGVGFAERKGDLALPRFHASGRFDLLPALDAMGLDKARRSPSALEAFGKGASLTQILQRAAIEVDEEGAEAAAATAVIATRALEQDDSLHMVVDKPLVFALRDRESGMILLAGYVGQAPKGKAG